MNPRLENELKSFKKLWRGGYYEGDPLDPVGMSGYGKFGFISSLHATYLRCIKPYVDNRTVSLEIGPGRGAWTKALLPSREVVVLDALPPEHNAFFEYLGYPSNVVYHQVADFECDMLPEDHFTYMFSFGCLCHVSFEGVTRYAESLFSRLKAGSNCFWMVADYDKYNHALSNLDRLSIWAMMPKERKYWLLKQALKLFMKRERIAFKDKIEDQVPRPGRWYHSGIERTCTMLEKTGFQVLDPDVGTCLRDPIIHFMKP